MGREKKKLAKQASNRPAKYVPPAPDQETTKKVPAFPEGDKSWYKGNFQWSQRSMDHEFAGDWDWNLSPKEARLILSNLEEMSEKTWDEISKETAGKNNRAKSHPQSVDDIVAAARDRLPDLHIDVEELYRIRLGYSERLWGYRLGGCFHVLWFDRHHKIYDD